MSFLEVKECGGREGEGGVCSKLHAYGGKVSNNGKADRCSSFLDRNGGQVEIYVKGKTGSEGEKRKVHIMTLTSGWGGQSSKAMILPRQH